jgi:NAD(P)-dependent dehydrogenase (short-subunit alcohol dehydrogenase family)
MQKLSGKVAVITGGNSGIGLAYAQPFAEEGGRVVIVGRRQDAVDTALASIGPEAMGFVGDVAEPMPRAHAVLRISGHAFWRHLFRGVSTRCRQIAAIVNENAMVAPSVIHNGCVSRSSSTKGKCHR